MLHYSKQYLPIRSFQPMYRKVVEPYFRSSLQSGGRVCEVTAVEKLQKLQNHIARIVTDSRYNDSVLHIMKQLGWQTVSYFDSNGKLKMVYKFKKAEAPCFRGCPKPAVQEFRNNETNPHASLLRIENG